MARLWLALVSGGRALILVARPRETSRCQESSTNHPIAPHPIPGVPPYGSVGRVRVASRDVGVASHMACARTRCLVAAAVAAGKSNQPCAHRFNARPVAPSAAARRAIRASKALLLSNVGLSYIQRMWICGTSVALSSVE